jgi:hypothetical protein
VDYLTALGAENGSQAFAVLNDRRKECPVPWVSPFSITGVGYNDALTKTTKAGETK